MIFAAGGGIFGHPGGIAAGVAALRLAWDAAVAGVPLVEHARQHPALRRTGSEHADRNGLEIVL